MPISCHFLDCKALLGLSLTHVSSAIASTRPLLLPLRYLSLRLSHSKKYGGPAPIKRHLCREPSAYLEMRIKVLSISVRIPPELGKRSRDLKRASRNIRLPLPLPRSSTGLMRARLRPISIITQANRSGFYFYRLLAASNSRQSQLPSQVTSRSCQAKAKAPANWRRLRRLIRL